MARSERRGRRQGSPALDTPTDRGRSVIGGRVDPEVFGRWSERFARFMGTARFLMWMSVVVISWLSWNSLVSPSLQFDPRALNYTLLTLILSLQASYAAPLILLAQNRQTDRDRVGAEQDRQRAERALADTEYLTREVVGLRLAITALATRDELDEEIRDAVRAEIGAVLKALGDGDLGREPRRPGETRSD